MLKNDVEILGDLMKDMLYVALQKLNSTDETADLDLDLESELSIEDLLNEDKKEDNFKDRLQYASDLMNQNIKNAEEKVKNKERKILIDSPLDVKNKKESDSVSCSCDCGCSDKNKKESESCSCGCECSDKNKLNVKNSFTASSLNEQKEDKVKLINVNKTAEKILTKIYDDIKSNAEKKFVEYDFMDEQWDNLLLNVRLVTVLKVLERVANHLKSNGFAVTSYNVYTEDSIAELYMAIDW